MIWSTSTQVVLSQPNPQYLQSNTGSCIQVFTLSCHPINVGFIISFLITTWGKLIKVFPCSPRGLLLLLFKTLAACLTLMLGHSTFISIGFLHLIILWFDFLLILVLTWICELFFLYSLFIYIEINNCMLSSLLSSSNSLSWKVSYSSGPSSRFSSKLLKQWTGSFCV